MAGTNSTASLVNRRQFNRKFARDLASAAGWGLLALTGAAVALAVFVVVTLPLGAVQR